ncbi:hypothetical protein VTI74DRAFT_1458 [Chaetomium olivicolor]
MYLIRPLPVLLSLLPLIAAEILGSWTIYALTRHSNPDDTACTYGLTLEVAYDHSSADVHATHDRDIQTCSFTIHSTSPPTTDHTTSGSSRTQQASQTDFTAQPCGSRFSVNGGWDREGGFLTLVMTDVTRDAYAFFGYQEEELRVGGMRGGG